MLIDVPADPGRRAPGSDPPRMETPMPDMPKFTKSSPEIIERFRAAMTRAAAPDVVVKPMFGYQCAWIGGNMATGLFADEWWVRVSEPDRAVLVALPGAHPFEPMPGRSMGRYVVLPADVVARDADLDAWLARAFEFTRSMPPKKK
ncbi:MAG: TfoX family protein [Chloroflexota bacterium]|nr:MAG: TfoX family protein [Chloroflexota bacterium]